MDRTPGWYLAVGAGGAAGATARWAVGTTVGGGAFPVATLAVNIAGCLVLGAVLARRGRRSLAADVVGVGFCGGLTTFSTFAVEVAARLDDGRPAVAAAYLVASVAGGLAAFLVGAAAARRGRAPDLAPGDR